MKVRSSQSIAPPPWCAVTVSVADAEAVLLAFCPVVSELAAMVSVYEPAAPLETLRVMVQLPLAGMVPPARASVPEPAVKEPLQVVAGTGDVAIVTPLGTVLVRAAWVSG